MFTGSSMAVRLACVMLVASCGSGSAASDAGSLGGSPGTGGATATGGITGTGGSQEGTGGVPVDAATGDGEADAVPGPIDGGADLMPIAGKRLFVTSALYPGKLGGLTGADDLCAAAATAASLGGTWVAWLSAPDVDAIERIAGNGPWQRLDGAVAFSGRAALESAPAVPLSIDEHGASVTPPSAAPVWTATLQGGVRDQEHNCSNWTQDSSLHDATVGDAGDTARWTATGALRACSETARLYCFEQ
jgi:hypothetical protein